MGLPGKPDGIDGSRVEEYFNAGRIQEIADYCRSDPMYGPAVRCKKISSNWR